MGYTNLGTGQGRIYAVRGGKVFSEEKNHKEGLRLMKSLGLKSRALALGQRGTFVITVDEITGSGTIAAITVNGVDQISGTINYNTGEEIAVANEIASKIATHIPASGQNYTAINVGNIVVGYAPIGAPVAINGHTVAVSNSGDITLDIEDVSGVPDQTEVYSTTHGFQFFVDSSPTAPSGNYSGADEVTKFIVPQTLDGALPSSTVELSGDIATAPRVGAISFLKLESQSGDSDTCIGINPQGYADNDLVYVCAVDSDTTITFSEDENGNLLLKDSEDFVSSTDVGEYILFRHIAGTFIELMRAGGSGGGADLELYEELLRSEALAKIGSSTIVPGKTYLITDAGHAGVILRGEATNRLSLSGTHYARVPDWQNTTGDFVGAYDGSSVSIGDVVACGYGRQYVNLTGNAGTSPPGDSVNWQLLDRDDSEYYINEVQSVIYDIHTGKFLEVNDKRGNCVKISQAVSGSGIGGDFPDWFIWGCDKVKGNTWEFSDSDIETPLGLSENPDGIPWVNDDAVISYQGGVFEGNTIKNSQVYLVIGTFTGNTLINTYITRSYGTLIGNIIENSWIHFEQVDGEMRENTFRNCKDQVYGDIVNVSASRLAACTIENAASPDFLRDFYSDDSFASLNSHSAGESTFEVVREVGMPDEDTMLDVSGGYGEIYISEGSVVDKLYLSLTESIKAPVRRFKLKTLNGVTVTLVGGDPSSPSPGDILIPEEFRDEESASLSYSGSESIDTSDGTLTFGGLRNYVELSYHGNYFIVEKVIRF